MHAGTGSHVDDMVGRADGVFVMLDNDDGVAEVAQADESREQAFIVALMQADGWFVEDVEDACEAAADL